MHPDQHAIASVPGADIDVLRLRRWHRPDERDFADISAQCAPRRSNAADLADCKQLLSRVPTQLFSLNKGLSTLQFQSLSVDPQNPKHLMGGTQDNGTCRVQRLATVWNADHLRRRRAVGFNAANPTSASTRSPARRTTRTSRAATRRSGSSSPGRSSSSPEGAYFYAPVHRRSEPGERGHDLPGLDSVWRTQDWGGNQAFLEANCPEFTTSRRTPTCGDFVRIGPAGARRPDRVVRPTTAAPTAPAATSPRSSGPRATPGTLWAATGAGRVFVSKNANAPAASVTYTRIDTLATERAGPVRQRHLRRPGEPEPRVDLVLGLQRQHAGTAGTRLRGHAITRPPGRRRGRTSTASGPMRRPADDRPRPRRRRPATSTRRPTSAC